jgi:hypothetical protein
MTKSNNDQHQLIGIKNQLFLHKAAFLASLGALAWLIVDPKHSLLTPDIQLDAGCYLTNAPCHPDI